MAMPAHTEFCNPDVAKVIRYEFRMFRHLYDRLWLPCRESGAFSPGEIEPMGTGDTDETRREVSAQLESFLLHARVLRDFLYYFQFKPDKTKRHRDDDVMAQDYISGWDASCPPLGDYLRDEKNKKRLDKALAHLTTTRVEFKRKELRWEVTRIRDELQPVIDLFLDSLSAELRSWFDESEDGLPM
jgi:hypothetical protein